MLGFIITYKKRPRIFLRDLLVISLLDNFVFVSTSYNMPACSHPPASSACVLRPLSYMYNCVTLLSLLLRNKDKFYFFYPEILFIKKLFPRCKTRFPAGFCLSKCPPAKGFRSNCIQQIFPADRWCTPRFNKTSTPRPGKAPLPGLPGIIPMLMPSSTGASAAEILQQHLPFAAAAAIWRQGQKHFCILSSPVPPAFRQWSAWSL